METILDIIQQGHLLLIGLAISLFTLAMVFRKKIERQWEYEAELRDKWGSEVGELDIQMSRVCGESVEFLPGATLVFRHESLTTDQIVQVYIEDELILEGRVSKDGRVHLADGDLMSDLESVSVGQVCTVKRGGEQLAEGPLVRD